MFKVKVEEGLDGKLVDRQEMEALKKERGESHLDFINAEPEKKASPAAQQASAPPAPQQQAQQQQGRTGDDNA